MHEPQVTVVGNIVSPISQKRLDDGTLRASFRVVNNQRRFDRTAGAWVDGDRFAVQVTCWRRLAENVVASLGTGDPVAVTGRLYTHYYEFEGRSRSATAMDASTVAVDLTRSRVKVSRTGRRAAEMVDVVEGEPGDVPGGETEGRATAAVPRGEVDRVTVDEAEHATTGAAAAVPAALG